MKKISIALLICLQIGLLAGELLFASVVIDDRVYKATITRDIWGVPHVFGKTDADAAFGMAFALDTKPRQIPADRPSEFDAKKGSPYYPRYGSSRGKVLTRMKGAVQTNKAFTDFVNALIRLGGSTKDKVGIKRTITQSMKLK